MKDKVLGLPRTVPLYYEDPYLSEFDSKILDVIDLGGNCYVVLKQTCFFPEGGGQLGDVGLLTGPRGKLKVADTQSVGDVIVHIAVPVSGKVEKGDHVHGRIDWKIRYDRMRHHTGSHVVFSSVKRVLGLEELRYMGVQIGEKRSRMDVSYGKPISLTQLMKIENLSNKICLENRRVKTWFTTREEAEHIYGKELGVTEVTPSGRVRVVEVEGWDVALCCGTHVSSTAEVGLIKILERFRLQKGVERIEFSAGEHAYEHFESATRTLREIAQALKTSTEEVVTRVNLLLKERDLLKEEIKRVKSRLLEAQATELLNQARRVGEFRLISMEVPDVDAQGLKIMATALAKRDSRLIAILGGKAEGKAFIVGAAGQKAVEDGVNMGDVIKEAAKVIGGGGGGAAKVAQAGGKDVGRLEQALRQCSERVLAKIRGSEGSPLEDA